MSKLGKSLIISVLMSALGAHAQNTRPDISIPDRMVFRVVADNKIDTRHARVGDKVKMSVVSPETLDDGTVIRAGARLEGHVVEVLAYSETNHEARLSLVIERLQWKKHWIPIHAFVIALGQVHTTQAVGSLKDPCSGPFSKRSARYYCPDDSLVTDTGRIQRSSDSSVLRDIELLQSGTPPSGSCLISHKQDIVVEDNMAFLIRNVIPK